MVRIRRAFLITVILLFSLAKSAYAIDERVFDEASLFSDSEKLEMNEKIKWLSDQLEIDIVIVTTNDNQGKSTKQFAEDFYYDHDIGYDTTEDEILYLLNMDDREVYISTGGIVRDVISDWQVEEILDVVYIHLTEEQYSNSVFAFLEEVERRMVASSNLYENGGTAGDSGVIVHEEVNGEVSFWQESLIYLAISVVVGGITVGVMAMYNRGRLTVNERTYLDWDSFVITRKVDRHYNTIVTQQKIQRNHSSGGGGSSFRGGLGGGGRKF